jgi:hypothetical protein
MADDLYDMDVPELVEVYDFDDEFPFQHGGRDVQIGYDDQGERYYLRHDVDRPHRDDIVGKNLASYFVLNDVDVTIPERVYDRANDRVIIEDLGDPHNIGLMDDKVRDLSIDPDRDAYLTAAASKLLVGDGDAVFNILMDDDGMFYPIDYEVAGNPVGEIYHQVVDAVEDHSDALGLGTDEHDLQERACELAQEADLEQIREQMRDEPVVDAYYPSNPLTKAYNRSQETFHADTMLDNIRKIRQRDFSEYTSLTERMLRTIGIDSDA